MYSWEDEADRSADATARLRISCPDKCLICGDALTGCEDIGGHCSSCVARVDELAGKIAALAHQYGDTSDDSWAHDVAVDIIESAERNS
jgi:hypothetical protein